MIQPESVAAGSIAGVLAAAPQELRFETELLIARTLDWTRARVLAFAEHEFTADHRELLHRQLQRLHSGEPYAYIVGEREFFGLEFAVTPDVLIPRPDTELLVELAIEHCAQVARVVDLGTGSGAIAISLKHARPDLQITATDKSAAALDIANGNAQRHAADITLLISDWFASLPGTFDTILSNPPYIARGDKHLADLSHEPASALVSGTDGLADLRIIATGAATALQPGGQLFVEHGAEQAGPVAELFRAAGLDTINTHRDLAGHSRVTSARRPVPD